MFLALAAFDDNRRFVSRDHLKPECFLKASTVILIGWSLRDERVVLAHQDATSADIDRGCRHSQWWLYAYAFVPMPGTCNRPS